MEKEVGKKEIHTSEVPVSKKPVQSGFSRDGATGGHQKNPRRKKRVQRERVKPEFESTIVAIRRVTRVVAGGRRFSFSVSLVAGDRNGRVGVGLGKATDTTLAIEKAMRNAERNMIVVTRTKEGSIPHEVQAKYNSAEVLLYPAPGKGLTAGSSVRDVLDLAGIKDVGGKLLTRTKNKLNNARSAVRALKQLQKQK
jgi:small subunit ribosomal protein S5